MPNSVEPIEFAPEELVPQGTFWSNTPIARWHSAGNVCGIWPPTMPVVGLSIMAIVIGAFFVGAYIVIDRTAENVSTGLRVLIVALGIVTTLGAPGIHVLVILHRQKRGPVMVYHKIERRLELPQERLTYELPDVVCLQVLAVRHNGDTHAELNLLATRDGIRRRHLLLTAFNSFDSAFDFLLKPMRDQDHVPIRIVKISQPMLSGQIQIREV